MWLIGEVVKGMHPRTVIRCINREDSAILTPRPHPTQICRYLPQPAFKLIRVPQAIQILVGMQERLLRQILGFREVLCPMVGNPVHN